MQRILFGMMKKIVIADRLNIGLPADWFQTLLRMPDVIKTEAQEVNEEEWNVVEKAIKEAIGHLCDFRIQEAPCYKSCSNRKLPISPACFQK